MRLIYFSREVSPPSCERKSNGRFLRLTRVQTAVSPPSIASVLGYLGDEFDVDDIDGDANKVELSFDLNEDIDASDIEDNLGIDSPRMRQKKVKTDTRYDSGDTTEPQASTTFDNFAKEPQEQIQAPKNEQETRWSSKFQPHRTTYAPRRLRSPSWSNWWRWRCQGPTRRKCGQAICATRRTNRNVFTWRGPNMG